MEQTQNEQKHLSNFHEETEFDASISPVTNSDHPSIKTNEKDKEQFAAYKNFVKNIETMQKMKLQNQDFIIDREIVKLEKEFKNTKTESKEKKAPSNEFNKFTEFIEKKTLSRNKMKTASSSCTNLRMTKNEHFKISHIPSTAKLASQGLNIKDSGEELKGKPYIEKKPRKQLVLKEQKLNSSVKELKISNEIKLRVQKLPELKPEISETKIEIDRHKIEEFKDVEAIIRKKKLEKFKTELSLSPILKTYEPRYFGLDNKSTNFEKMGLELLNEIRNKYWCYDNLENEEVYENFELFLCSNLHK